MIPKTAAAFLLGTALAAPAAAQPAGSAAAGAAADAQAQPAAAPPAAAEPPAERRAGGFDRLWRLPTLYKNDEASGLNELRIVGRLHLDNYVLEAEQADASDLVVRRARIGAKARLFGKLDAHVEADLDLEGGALYDRLTDAYLAWRFSDAARVAVGKQSVKFTLDGATSSNELLTIDRSNVANNFWFTDEYIPGVGLSGRNGKWSYNGGIYSGGRSNGEFGDFDGGFFMLGSVGRDISDALGVERAALRADYVYNEPDADSDFTRPFEHIGSLVFILDAGGWGVSADVVRGDGFLGQSDAWGATLLPWFDITDRLQLATRYTFVASEERNGVRLARYAMSRRGDAATAITNSMPA